MTDNTIFSLIFVRDGADELVFRPEVPDDESGKFSAHSVVLDRESWEFAGKPDRIAVMVERVDE